MVLREPSHAGQRHEDQHPHQRQGHDHRCQRAGSVTSPRPAVATEGQRIGRGIHGGGTEEVVAYAGREVVSAFETRA